jgi:hypothetical protein
VYRSVHEESRTAHTGRRHPGDGGQRRRLTIVIIALLTSSPPAVMVAIRRLADESLGREA